MHYWMLDENTGYQALDRAPACFQSCIQANMDYGGRGWHTISGIECPFAPVIAIIADSPDFQHPAWATRDAVPITLDGSMDSAEECQARCGANPTCDYFSCKYTCNPTTTCFQGHL